MNKRNQYEYDSERNVLIRVPSAFDGLPEIFYKSERAWRRFNERDEQYSRAIYLGQGCWERLNSISEEEAEKILKEWTQTSR